MSSKGTRTRPVDRRRRIVFVLPVLAPYHILRFQDLGKYPDLDIHVILECDRFDERPGWVARDIEGCHVHVLRSPRTTKQVRDPKSGYLNAYTKAYPLGLSPVLFRLRPDAVIVCNPTQYLLALPARWLTGFRFGLVLEDTPWSESKKSRIVLFIRKILYKNADFVFCFSADARVYLDSLKSHARAYQSSWSINPDWLDAPRTDIGNDGGMSQGKAPRFLFVGALIDRKGVMPMLMAWHLFIQRGGTGSLTLVGDGPLRTDIDYYCRTQALDSVHLRGNIPYDKVRDYYLSCDAFILPTMEDLYALVVTEAMAFGLPIMLSIYSGGRELVKPGENGVIFDPAEVEEIVEAFQAMPTEKERLAEMGRRSREIIAEYTHEKVMGRMHDDIVAEL